MNSISEIRKRINRVIDNEIELTTKERDKFEEKMHDEESYYGFGGQYQRFERCMQKREKHLEELEQLRDQSSAGLQMTETLRLYPWACPSCEMVIYLTDGRSRYGLGSEIVDCPICQRTLYRSGYSTKWDVVKGSKYTETHRHN